MRKFYRLFSVRNLLRCGGVAGMSLNLACSDDGIDTEDELGYQLVVVGEGAGAGREIISHQFDSLSIHR